MKKLILSAAMLAFGSFTAFGAACSTIAPNTVANLNTIGVGGCTVGSAGQWTLTNFNMVEMGAQNYGPSNDPTTSSVQVTFANVVGNGTLGANGAQGFSVTFSYSGSGTNFFNSDITGQSAQWKSQFTVDNLGVDANDIVGVYNQLNGAAQTANAAVQVNKFITENPGSAPIGNVNVLYAFGGNSANPAAVAGMVGNTRNLFNVIDSYQIQGSPGATASLASYTNYFFAAPDQTGVPEPMSFVLMGVGLVGIAALRRRNG